MISALMTIHKVKKAEETYKIVKPVIKAVIQEQKKRKSDLG